MNNNIFYNLLLSKNPVIVDVALYINKTCISFFGAIFLAGAILEFLNSHEYKSLLFRSLIAFVVIINFQGYLDQGIKLSFDFSDQALKKFDKNNPLVQSLIKADLTNRKKFMKNRLQNLKKKQANLWDKFVVLAQVIFDDPLTTVLFVFTFFCFLLLQNIYSIIYSLLYIFISIIAILSIFGPTQNSLSGAFRTSLMLFLTPPVMAIIFILMGGHASYVTAPGASLIDSLEGLMQLLITSIMLLFSPIFANAIISGGLAKVGGKIATLGASAVLPAGLQSINTIAKSIIKKPIDIFKGAAKSPTNFTKRLVQSGANKTKDKINNKAQDIYDKYDNKKPPHKSYHQGHRENQQSPIHQPPSQEISNFEKAVIWSDKILNHSQKKDPVHNSKPNRANYNPNDKRKLQRNNSFQPKEEYRNSNAQKIITELNQGQNRLSNYSPQDLKKALNLAKMSESKKDKSWIKNRQLYWLLHQMSKDEEKPRPKVKKKNINQGKNIKKL